jgi:hypothetical protein
VTSKDTARKETLEARHPGTVIVRDDAGVWKGHVPLRGGGHVFKARYEWDEGPHGGGLPQLLDDLEAALAAEPGDTS